jgi:MerR family transcriptional regulator, light-induced transcriptional regulator
MDVAYPIRAVSRLTGLCPDTIRAWERRYGAIIPVRKGLSRVFSQEQIHRLMLLREVIGRGHSIGQIASMTDDQLRELLSRNAAMGKSSLGRFAPSGPEPPLLVPILQAVDSFSPASANEEITRLSLLLPMPELIHQVILPLMRIVGERWHRGTWGISQEHLISALLRNLMGTLIRMNQPRTAAPMVLATTPSGELHEFGALASAVLASSLGMEVIYLGPDLPAMDLVFAAERCSPDVVILGLTNPQPQKATLEDLVWIANRLPPGIELWLGGPMNAAKQHDQIHPRCVHVGDFRALQHHLCRLKQGAEQSNPLASS